MHISNKTDRRIDETIGLAGALILLLGAATGNALVMLAMSLVGIAVITLLYRNRLGIRASLTILASMVVAAVIAGWVAMGLSF